jgi:hypothetical protein
VRLVDPERSYAVLIGTSAYWFSHPVYLPNLPEVTANLYDLATALTDPNLGGFRPDHCSVLFNPPNPLEISRELNRKAAQAKDTLLVYFAGHGLRGMRTDELYLSTAHTELSNLAFTALRYNDLRDFFLDKARYPAANRIVILDCCFSGHAIPRTMSDNDIGAMFDIEGTYILTATRRHERALAMPAGGRHTAFTGALLDILRQGVADGPDLLSLDTIYDQVYQRLVSQRLPEPRKLGSGTIGALALTRNPARPRDPDVTLAVPRHPTQPNAGATEHGLSPQSPPELDKAAQQSASPVSSSARVSVGSAWLALAKLWAKPQIRAVAIAMAVVVPVLISIAWSSWPAGKGGPPVSSSRTTTTQPSAPSSTTTRPPSSTTTPPPPPPSSSTTTPPATITTEGVVPQPGCTPDRFETITLNPERGPIQTQITITGAGFTPDDRVDLSFYFYKLGFVVTDCAGRFTATYPVPRYSGFETSEPHSYEIVADQSLPYKRASAYFVLTP